MDKRPEKMTEQDKLLEIQMNLKGKTKAVDIITVVSFLLIIFFFAIAIYIVPDAEYSEQENRYLQQFPEISTDGKFPDRLIEGKFTAEIADYFADQLPGRDIFVGIKGVMEIALLKRQNNDVTLASDGYIIERDDYPNYTALNGNLTAIKKFGDALEELGIPYSFALAGRSMDALQRYLPALYPTFHSDKLWSSFTESVNENGNIQFINLLEPLKAIVDGDSGEQLYYKTDHHWTTLGAYYGYAEIMKALGEEPQPLENFQLEEVSDAFYGTTWSSAGMKWVEPDTMYYFRYEGDDADYTTTIVDSGVSFKGFYDRSYLSVKDKYSSFIGGNNARVDIVKDTEEDRETMLLIKDSFAHSVAPFLAYHYDLIIIDLRHYRGAPIELVKDEDVDRVLILNYMGSFTSINVFGQLQLKL